MLKENGTQLWRNLLVGPGEGKLGIYRISAYILAWESRVALMLEGASCKLQSRHEKANHDDHVSNRVEGVYSAIEKLVAPAPTYNIDLHATTEDCGKQNGALQDN